jgi:DNA-binding MarR family transcriptional regulator
MSEKTYILYDFLMRHAWHKLSRMYNQKAGEHGITMSIGFILMIVDRDGTPSTQLGPRMGMEPTSLSRTLKTMEDRGLIHRGDDGIDKRKVLIFLTDKGVELRRIVRGTIVEFNDKILQHISDEKLEIYQEVLDDIDRLAEEELKIMSKNNAKK